MRLLTILAVAVFAMSHLGSIESAKILSIFPYPGPSQYILVQPYLRALAALGHEVTSISAFPQKEKISNFRDIPHTEVFKNYDDLIVTSTNEMSMWQELNLFSEFFNNITISVFENPRVQQLLHSQSEQFDLVIVEAMQADPLYAFAQHFNASLIGVSSFGTDGDVDSLVGNTSPVSYVPLLTSGLTDRMNFGQRLRNLVYSTMEVAFKYTILWPQKVEIYKKYFPNAKLDLADVSKSFSLMLLNNHFTLSFPRPYVPSMIEVGGFHLNHKPSPLPQDMEAFINGSQHGVIYFSMGSNIKSKNLPKEKLEILLKTFASLKQNVMWKFEDPDLPGKPKNVFISKWFPQPDILAHPNVKVFFTHCGLLSTIEAIYHGKPVVGMPIFYDQFLNVERAKKAGYGLSVDFHNLNEVDLKATLLDVFNNPSYANVAAKKSQNYRDQPMKPLDKAIFWTEYVLRHKGAAHMRVAAQDLNFIQFHSLDTAAVLFGGLLFIVLLIVLLVYKLVKFVCGKKCTKKRKQKKH